MSTSRTVRIREEISLDGVRIARGEGPGDLVRRVLHPEKDAFSIPHHPTSKLPNAPEAGTGRGIDGDGCRVVY